jgi:thymidylate synthase ThyX
MTVSVGVIADSISTDGIRLVTLQLRYPRFIHAEFMTHRVFSRNASSSRAVPVAKLIEDIKRDTAMPMHWGKNQKGMQADEECNELVGCEGCSGNNYGQSREDAWFESRDNAIAMAEAFDKAGYHKQIVNRLLEPFSHINVVVTSTDWANFFHLRDHKDAMPEIQELARLIKNAMYYSPSAVLKPGEWHLPYITDQELKNWLYKNADLEYQNKILIKCSVARCARVSYLTYEGKQPEIQADLALYDRLVGSEPLHASPAEHQATPDEHDFMLGWLYPKEHANLRGWRQYRKMLPNECVTDGKV